MTERFWRDKGVNACLGRPRLNGARRCGVPQQDPLNARRAREFAHRALGHPPLEARDPKNVRVKATRSTMRKAIS